jgi:nucleotide-binding universal stress UspA family protein
MSLPKTIVVATDFSESSEVAVGYAAELARAVNASVRIVHVVDELAARFIDAPSYEPIGRMQTELERTARVNLDAVVAGLKKQIADVTGAVVTSRATSEAIISYTRDVRGDLLVMGTHGRGPVRRFFLGSVAERVVRMAPCPVVTIRPEPAPQQEPEVAAKRDIVVI